MRFPSYAILTLCGLLASGCASRTPDQVEDLLFQALRAATTHHEYDLDPEALVLLDAMSEVDPDYPGLRELGEDLDASARLGVERGPLGMNRKLRPRVERSARTRALLYLPDRLLDLFDVVTVGVHFGIGGFADAHATRAVQVVGGFRSTGGIGLHDHRSIGLKSQAEAGLTLIAVGTHTYGGSLVGTSGTHGSVTNAAGAHRPGDPLYEDLRDYWALGASATAGIVGAEADFHPLQLADFLAGIFGVDFLNDDLAYTRSLELDAVESKLVAELRRVGSSTEQLAAYQEAKGLGALTGGRPRPPSGKDGSE